MAIGDDIVKCRNCGEFHPETDIESCETCGKDVCPTCGTGVYHGECEEE